MLFILLLLKFCVVYMCVCTCVSAHVCAGSLIHVCLHMCVQVLSLIHVYRGDQH